MNKPLPPDINITYEIVFSNIEANQYFNVLEKEIHYLDKFAVFVGNKMRNVPRQVVAYGDTGLTYRFSGTKVVAKPWIPILLELKKLVQKKTGQKYNFVLINRYRNGYDNINKHRDDEHDLVKDAFIATLSFGETRRFIFSRLKFKSFSLLLKNGSLLVMKPPTNQYWYHSIPKEINITGRRISLTFRNMKRRI